MLSVDKEPSVGIRNRHMSRDEKIDQAIYPESRLPTGSPGFCTMQSLNHYRDAAYPCDRACAQTAPEHMRMQNGESLPSNQARQLHTGSAIARAQKRDRTDLNIGTAT